MATCEQCGNPTNELTCPFCEFAQSPETVAARRLPLQIVNVKQGMPAVHEAQARLLDGLNKALVSGADLLLVVHGHGSSGRGGEIRRSIRRTCEQWAGSRLEAVHFGESFLYNRDWRRRCPELARHGVAANPGVTLLELGA